MNKKILVGIAIVIVAVGIVSIKAMLGDESTELPYEEQSEKTLNLQESGESGVTGDNGVTGDKGVTGDNGGTGESGVTAESGEQEAKENNP